MNVPTIAIGRMLSSQTYPEVEYSLQCHDFRPGKRFEVQEGSVARHSYDVDLVLFQACLRVKCSNDLTAFALWCRYWIFVI